MMRINVWRVIAFFLVIALSVGFGFAYDATLTAIERHEHPKPPELTQAVQAYSSGYGVPDAIVWATLCVGSGFASNAVSEDGAIGLMQLTPEQFFYVRKELIGKETTDAGLLYDPETNLQCGVAWLSHLYERYGVWELTLAAYRVGPQAVDAWLADPQYVDEQGVLIKIPDAKTAAYVKKVTTAAELYRKLYYET